MTGRLDHGAGDGPVLTASFVVDAGCVDRLVKATARGGALRTGRYFGALLPAALAGGAWFALRSKGGNTLIGVVIGLVVVVVVWALATVALSLLGGGVGAKVTRAIDSAAMPVGSSFTVDYYADRLVTRALADVQAVTQYADLVRVVVKPTAVVLERPRGAFALPIEVVPPAAQQLLTDAVAARRTG